MLMCQTSFGDGCRTLLQLSRQVALAQCCPRLCEVTADMTANSLRQFYSLSSVRWISCISGCPHQVTKTYLPSRKGWRKGLMWYFSHQDSPLTTPDSIFNANEHKSLGWKEGKDSRRYQNPGQQRRSSFCSGCFVVQHLHGQEILWCYCRQRAAETEKLILPSRKQRRSKSYEQVQTVGRPEQRLLKSDSHDIPDHGLLTCIAP